MKEFCEENGKDYQDYTPLTFNLNLKDKNWEQDLQCFMDFFLKYQPVKLNTGKRFIEIRKKYKKVDYDRNYKNGTLASNVFGDQGGQQQSNSHQQRPIMKPSFMSPDRKSYVWLLKPVSLNRGRGIEVFSTLEQLEKFLNEYFEGFQEKSFKEIGQKMKQKDAFAEEYLAEESLGEEEEEEGQAENANNMSQCEELENQSQVQVQQTDQDN